MPNYCDTKYVFVGSETEIADLHKKLKSIPNDSSMSRNLESLGRVCGINCEEIDCDGDIGCFELESPTKLELETLTNHRENNAVFKVILKDYPSIQCFFSAECNDSSYYVTNDYGRQYFPERFIVKEGCEEPQYFNNPPRLFAYISELLSCEITSMEQMKISIEEWNGLHDDNSQISVNKIELTTDLCQKDVWLLVGRMERSVKTNTKILYSGLFNFYVRLVCKTLCKEGFVWVISTDKTALYRENNLEQIQRLLRVMDCFDKNKEPYTIWHHRRPPSYLQPRSSGVIREWAKRRIDELTEKH